MSGRVVLILSSLAALTVRAADFEVTSENSPCDFLSAKNSAGTRFILHDGAVLSCTNKASGSNYSHIWVNANCAVTLDVTGVWGGTYVNLLGGITLEEGATLKIVGKTDVRMALRNNFGSDVVGNYAKLAIAGLSFADASGNAIAGSLTIKGPGTIVSWPTDDKVSITVEAGVKMAFFGENTLAKMFPPVGGVLTVDRDIYVLQPRACGENALAVAAGCQVDVLPVSNLEWASGKGSEWIVVDGRTNDPVRVAALAGELLAEKNAPVLFESTGTFAYAKLQNRDSARYVGATDGVVSVADLAGDYPDAKITTVGAVRLSGVGTVPVVGDQATTLQLDDAEANPVVYGGAETVTFEGPTWPSPKLWLDAKVSTSFAHTGYRTADLPHPSVSETEAAKYAQPLYASDYGNALVVERWFDCRDTEKTGTVGPWQIRYYGGNDFTFQVYPLFRTDAADGRPYLFCGTPSTKFSGQLNDESGTKIAGFVNAVSSRLPFYNDVGAATPTQAGQTDIKTVVMVFGSQQGGGFAFLGTSGGAFGRGDVTNAYTSAFPITTNGEHAVWLNGERITPNETKYSGGWDILSVDTEGLTISSLGSLEGNSNSKVGGTTIATFGGQNYAEVLFFTNKLTDVERKSVERYLAKKWDLMAKYADASRYPATVMGTSGTVAVKDAKVALSGNFSGTLALDGADVEIADAKRPLSPADVADGRLLWLDPDNEAWCTSGSDGHVSKLLNAKAEQVDGDPLGVGSGARAPNWFEGVRGLGPSRRWIDFNDTEEDVGNGYGNTVRLQTVGTSDGTANTDTPLTAKTVIMVQDSVRGGGSPFLTKVLGQPNRRTADYRTNVWDGKDTPAAMTGAALRLNGVSTRASDGFTGCPEVYAVCASEDMTIGAFGNIYSTQGYSYENQRGEIQGEILVYRDALSDDNLAGLEAYLMSKWLNKLPEGYADLSKATVTGSGTVSAAKWSQLPKIGAEFSGTVTATSMDVNPAFSIAADGTVVGAVLAPDATLSLPTACTATVTLPDARLAAGEYTLVDCKGWGETAWTITVTDPKSAKRNVTVTAADGRIVLKVAPLGMMLLLR